MARQARSLDVALAEVNAIAPRRSKVSDGGIGDVAHQKAGTSDHLPNKAGVWRARDFTHDPAGGLDCNVLAARLVSLLGQHPALGSGAYLIWNRRIISTDRLGSGWRPYTGSNPHDKHLHVSVATAASGYDSTAPWGITEGEIDMASIDDIVRGIWLAKHDLLGGQNAVQYLRDLPVKVWLVRHGALGGRTAFEALATTEAKVDAVIDAVGKIDGVDPDEIRQAVREAVESITVTVKGA